ncbi:class I SAM-dependent methyltransferase [Nonomuraea sp. SBT364]|uniref:class I SAM-dependent methyltransferase n=1 Tax=Nonomuraea sp. SBT364 TaxID=1580530 RepID=UPI00066BBD10|nr:class I SAM-dependent methyltransferase [Nonomuraea sp. SBT364]
MFDHNDHYHALLLRQLPPAAGQALDVGCGTGAFARALAARGLEVDAVDPDEAVIGAARPTPGVRFTRGDITTMDLARDRYDFVSCLASLHHVPFGTVGRLREALAPGGVLAVLGCYRESTWSDHVISTAAVPVNAAVRLALAGRAASSPVRAPVSPPSMTLADVREQAATLLPGARIRRLLFWRYLLLFRKPRT